MHIAHKWTIYVLQRFDQESNKIEKNNYVKEI